MQFIPFDRPLFYTGDVILNSVEELLNDFNGFEELTEEQQKQKKFLHRIKSILVGHKTYNLSIDEAVYVGLLD